MVLSPRRRSANTWTSDTLSPRSTAASCLLELLRAAVDFGGGNRFQRFGQYRHHQLTLPTAGLPGCQELVNRFSRILSALLIPAQPSHQVGRDKVLGRH